MTSPGAEIPSHRACAHCRSQKVRCIASDNDPDVCQRCARSGRACVFTPLQKRKQRKRTDTRVAELEREMRSMRAAMKQKQESTSPDDQRQEATREEGPGLWYDAPRPDAARAQHPSGWGQDRVDNGQGDQEAVTQRTNTVIDRSSFVQSQLPSSPHIVLHADDVIARGVLSLELARELFETYRADLQPHYPMYLIPRTMTADEMRYSSPTLFLAILAAAAGKEHSDLSAKLDGEVLQAYAARVLVGSEKSLDLVQALLINAAWYHPPNRFGELKYYEYILMAITMAMDIGVAARPTTHRTRFANGGTESKANLHPAEDSHNPDLSMAPRAGGSRPITTSVESRRTWLACYVLCASVSLSLRRPNMLRVNSYIRDCVDYLERSPDAQSTDRTVIAWVKLVMIADEISASFCLDDPGGIALITELRTQLMLRDFSNRLGNWYSSLPEADAGPGSLLVMYYTVRLYLNEIALHVDHSPEDFRAPYQMGDIQPLPRAEDIPTQVLATAISDCISSAHSMMNTFTSMSADGLRAVPVFTFVRVSFSAFVLAKLCLSASRPSSRIANVTDRSSIKAEAYLDRTILHVRNVVGTHRCRVPAIFLALLFKLRQWCLNPDMINRADREIFSTVERPKPETKSTEGRRGKSKSHLSTVLNAVTADDGASSNGLIADALSDGTNTAGVTPDSQYHPETSSTPSGAADASTKYSQVTSNSAADLSGIATNGGAGYADQMDVDGNLFEFLGDMNAFSAGGLTGLDDWGMLPMGSYEVDNLYYQMPTLGYDATQTGG